MPTFPVEVQIRPWPEGGYLAEAPDLQGCWVVSDTAETAVDDIREAIQLWIRVRQEQGWPLPPVLRDTGPDVTIRTVLPTAVP